MLQDPGFRFLDLGSWIQAPASKTLELGQLGERTPHTPEASMDTLLQLVAGPPEAA